MVNIRLTISYDGTAYSGWQSQPDAVTLQDTLEAAIKRISGETLRVTASGRTDAGVHAYGQVVNFHTEKDIPPHEWTGGINHFLPEDMRIIDASVVPEEFSARYSARGKVYRYILMNVSPPSPLMLDRAWQLGYAIDIGAMREAAKSLLGEHDFSSFRAAGCSANHPVRTLRRLDIHDEPDERGTRINFTLEADAFLRHMVRNIVGTLVEVGRGRFTVKDMADILEEKDRTRSGPAAPPQGLYLVEVHY